MSLEKYYAGRAAEYEKIFEKPERQADLARMRTDIPALFKGERVLEIACGTGYWTPLIAEQAESVLATDFNEEPLAIARSKPYRKANVRFERADAYALPGWPQKFSACYAGFWWSHVPLGAHRRASCATSPQSSKRAPKSRSWTTATWKAPARRSRGRTPRETPTSSAGSPTARAMRC